MSDLSLKTLLNEDMGALAKLNYELHSSPLSLLSFLNPSHNTLPYVFLYRSIWQDQDEASSGNRNRVRMTASATLIGVSVEVETGGERSVLTDGKAFFEVGSGRQLRIDELGRWAARPRWRQADGDGFAIYQPGQSGQYGLLGSLSIELSFRKKDLFDHFEGLLNREDRELEEDLRLLMDDDYGAW